MLLSPEVRETHGKPTGNPRPFRGNSRKPTGLNQGQGVSRKPTASIRLYAINKREWPTPQHPHDGLNPKQQGLDSAVLDPKT